MVVYKGSLLRRLSSKHMRQIGQLALLAALTACLGLADVVVGIDENCNGAASVPLVGTFPLGCNFGADPGPGGLPNVMTYSNGFGVTFTQGDVLLLDNGVPLDVIRFNGDTTIIFYSDNLDGLDDLADTIGPPGAFYQNFVTLDEVPLAGGGDGASYVPQPGEPGYAVTQAGPVSYQFQSDSPGQDAAPEPATLFSLGGGLLVAAVARKLRRA